MAESRTGGGETLDGRGLLALSRTVTGTLDLQEVLDESFVALRRMISFDGGAIQLIEDGCLRAAATDPPAPPEAYTVRIPVGAGVSGVIAETGEPIYIPDITVDPRVHPDGRKKGLSGGVRSYFGAPLIEHGVPVGVVQIDSTRVDAFGLVERELVLSFLPTISAAVQNARLFEAEQRAHEHIRELERLQRDFLAMVSHELHTPLVKIIGFGDILAKGAAHSASEVQQLGEKIGAAGKHLARLIGDVVDVAGIGTVANPTEPVPTQVATLIQSALAGVPDAWAERVTVTIDPAAAEIHVDPGLLARVLGFLLDNALKFSDRAVEVAATPVAPTTVELAVRDSGEGIRPELLDRVFDRFFQADPSSTRRHGGMGVGLFLARTFCERMGHELRLQSTPGAGTVATVAVHGQPAATVRRPRPATRTSSAGRA